MVPSTEVPFIFSSSLSTSTRLSSCTSCCMKVSFVSHPNDFVSCLVDTDESECCSL